MDLSLVMFKFLLVWLLANYSYENISDTYKSYKTENPIQEITSFIDKQQFREDQLREHCNLQNFVMKEKPGYYDTIVDSIKQQITTTINKNLILSLDPSQLVSTKLMEADSYDELMNMSYSPENEGMEIIYEENNNVEELYQPKICSHSTCTMTAQPGREYCAFHCRLIIEEQKKEKQAS